jgi:hypothetical protein
MAVDPAIVKRVVLDFKKTKGWHFGGTSNRLNRHRGFFVNRRALILGGQHPGWLADPALTSLKAQIDSDLQTVETYLAGKLGTSKTRGPYWGGTDPVAPAHLDLLDMARPKTSQPVIAPGNVFPKPHGHGGNQAFSSFELRRNWVEAIVWRAAGIHQELWTPTFQNAALDELLDHRLRIVERMKYNVTAGATIGEQGMAFSSPTSGWVDGYRLRVFEYPRIKVRIAGQYIPASFIADPHANPPKPRWTTFDEPGQKDWWYKDDADGRLLWNQPPYAGVRFPPRLKPAPGADFSQLPGVATPDDRGNFRLRMTPPAGTPASAVVDLLFPSTDLTDSWDRSWIFCDHAIAALHIEALRFAKERREQGDTTFDGILTSHASSPGGPGYISLDALVGNTATPVNVPELMADQSDTKFFINNLVPEPDLEVGDHTIFWNCFAYSYVSEGDWRLENTLIMDVDSDPITGGQHRNQLALQGHGTSILLYARYINNIRKYFAAALKSLQAKVRTFAHDHPTATTLSPPWKGVPNSVIRWSPYEDFDPPGAWWVQISSSDWGNDDAAQKAIGLSVARDPTPGPGYNPPPGPGWVQFPLFQPAINGGWGTYLDKRRANANFRAPSKLVDVTVHATDMPGLFHDAGLAAANMIPCVRPRVPI